MFEEITSGHDQESCAPRHGLVTSSPTKRLAGDSEPYQFKRGDAPWIEDEFTKLPVSRQRKYQLRRKRVGRCPVCGRPSVGASIAWRTGSGCASGNGRSAGGRGGIWGRRVIGRKGLVTGRLAEDSEPYLARETEDEDEDEDEEDWRRMSPSGNKYLSEVDVAETGFWFCCGCHRISEPKDYGEVYPKCAHAGRASWNGGPGAAWDEA
jgi:hypothetical protein